MTGDPGTRHLRRTARAVRLRTRNTRDNLMSRKYCRQHPGAGKEILERTNGQDALLVTIAFNKPRLIELQLKMLGLNFQDSASVVVADNSNDPMARVEIHAACERHGALYVSLPPNPAEGGSVSHGLALNWVHQNILSHARTEYFGFLDHDVFPIRPVSYREIIRSQRSYGHFQAANGHLFYWPGLCFFTNGFFDLGGANFLPVMFGETYGDTGAGNWSRHYRQLDASSIRTFAIRDVWASNPAQAYVKLPPEDPARLHHFLSNALTLFDDDWVHLVNGSDWAEVDMTRKLQQLSSYLSGPQE